MHRALLSAVVILIASGAARAAEASFKTAPTAVKNGAGATVAFKLAAPADVEVSILNAQGAVVRHLAAGVLGGKNPPPAPLQSGLDQSIAWDGKDDFGKAAVGGPFQVRVRGGSGVKFGRFIGDDPYTFGGINSIAADEDGRLHAMSFDGALNQNMDTLRVFSADGSYQRTLLPFAADLAPERVKPAAEWDATRKSFVPHNGRSQLPQFYPWGGGARLVSASKAGIVLTFGTDVYRLDADGGNIRGPFPMWSKTAKLENPNWNIPQLAVSPDGRYIYYANVAGTKYQPKTFGDTNPNWPQGRVYRQDTSKAGSDPEKFYDLELPDWDKEKYWLPDAWNKRTAAYGLAVDGKGHVYVCDLVNQEIVEVDPQGKKVSATKAPWPERVHVDPGSGAYFVICRVDRPRDGAVEKKLVKVVGRGPQGKIVSELPLKQRGLGEATALGQANGQPVLWIAGGGALLCVRDAGDKLAVTPTAFKPREDAQQDWNRIAVDYERDEVYTSNGGNLLYRYDGKTGVGGVLLRDGKPFNGVDLAVGYDGNLYCRTGTGYSGPLERFDRDLKPVAFASGSHILSPYIYSRYGVGNCEKGVGVGPNGEAYVNFMYGWNKYFIAGFGPDGKPLAGNYLKGKIPQKSEGGAKQAEGLDSAVVGPIPASCGGIRVDLAGNLYVGMRLKPKEFAPPAGKEKDAAYTTWTGSIVKFGPNGGTVTGAVKEDDQPEKGKTVLADQGMTVEGALTIYPGVAPFSGGGYGGGGSSCVCRVPRFDLDRFGRLVFTNCVTNEVAVIDNAGNTILTFGAYGNFDSQRVPAGSTDRKPTVAGPAIPLAWPTGAGFGKEHIYVNDTYNRRVVRVDKTYAVEAVCPVK